MPGYINLCEASLNGKLVGKFNECIYILCCLWQCIVKMWMRRKCLSSHATISRVKWDDTHRLLNHTVTAHKSISTIEWIQNPFVNDMRRLFWFKVVLFLPNHHPSFKRKIKRKRASFNFLSDWFSTTRLNDKHS